MEERRRTRSQEPPTPAENNELIQWDPIQDPVRTERERTEARRLARQISIANNTTKNRTENDEISQQQHNNELDYEQITTHTPTTGEILPKEQRLENIGSQTGKISPKEPGLDDIGVRPGQIPPKQQQNGQLDFSSPKTGEIPQQKVLQLPTEEHITTGESEMINPRGGDAQGGSPRMDTAEHYLDDNFSDVMRSLAIGSNVSSLFNTTAFNTTNNEH